MGNNQSGVSEGKQTLQKSTVSTTSPESKGTNENIALPQQPVHFNSPFTPPPLSPINEAKDSSQMPAHLSQTEKEAKDEEKLINDSGLFSPNFLGHLVKNPGTMEDLHKKCKDVFPTPFDGSRVIINKGLSNYFQISHTINMSSTSSGYRFGATYVGSNVVGPGEAFPILLGDIDLNGNLSANIIHQFHPNIRTKLVTQFQESQCVATQLTSDFKGSTCTTSLTLANIDLINNSGIGILHFLQAVTPNVDVGLECAYQYGRQVPGGGVAALSVAARYNSADNYTLSGSISQMGSHVCYYHKAKEHLQVGVEVETNLRMGSTASFGYQFDYPKADLVFRGSVDSNWQVSGVLEKKLAPMPFTFLLSGHVNHARNTYKFGCGLLMG